MASYSSPIWQDLIGVEKSFTVFLLMKQPRFNFDMEKLKEWLEVFWLVAWDMVIQPAIIVLLVVTGGMLGFYLSGYIFHLL